MGFNSGFKGLSAADWHTTKKNDSFLKLPCNENQLDAVFILSLFRQSTSACFGHICSPSSGGILYIYNNWYVLCFLVDCLLAGYVSFMLTGCWQDRDHSDPANSQST